MATTKKGAAKAAPKRILAMIYEADADWQPIKGSKRRFVRLPDKDVEKAAKRLKVAE